YALTFGEASWPFVIDNTPPRVSLAVGDTRLVRDALSNVRDLLVNEIFAGVRDTNLLDWRYETRTPALQEWLVITTSDVPLERDGEEAWYAVGASQMVRRDLRLVASDFAGNTTVVSRAHRDERLLFTDSEPACRSGQVPCVYPDRPDLAGFGDGEGRLGDTAQVLDPSYDSLVVQSTVWTDELELRLEYRQLSLTGLPAGPWLPGEIQVAPRDVRRNVCTDEVSFVPEGSDCVIVRDGVRRLYWDHLSLPLVPHEVRLEATNDDGQAIASAEILYQPAVPLILEYLEVDTLGDHLRVTNASDSVVRNLVLTERQVVDGAVVWQPIGNVDVDRLGAGEFAELTTGCGLVDKGGAIVRMQGT
ncbi:MAG: hypothetical protein MI919_00690, partial [Holophagales bacterium]|nr:hypothetical protein [Holophagales bacterium]